MREAGACTLHLCALRPLPAQGTARIGALGTASVPQPRPQQRVLLAGLTAAAAAPPTNDSSATGARLRLQLAVRVSPASDPQQRQRQERQGSRLRLLDLEAALPPSSTAAASVGGAPAGRPVSVRLLSCVDLGSEDPPLAQGATEGREEGRRSLDAVDKAAGAPLPPIPCGALQQPQERGQQHVQLAGVEPLSTPPVLLAAAAAAAGRTAQQQQGSSLLLRAEALAAAAQAQGTAALALATAAVAGGPGAGAEVVLLQAREALRLAGAAVTLLCPAAPLT